MALRTGILSDKYFEENCVEYVSQERYENATFVGNFKNGFLNGVKTPYYQRTAFQAASPDVEAVNLAKLYKGNVYSNANSILDDMSHRIREYKAIEKKMVIQPLQEAILLGGVQAHKPIGIGNLLLNETIGSAAFKLRRDQFEIASGNPTYAQRDDIMARFGKLKSNEQEKLIRATQRTAQAQNIDLDEYSIAKFAKGTKAVKTGNFLSLMDKIALKNGSLPVEVLQLMESELNLPILTNQQMGSTYGSTLNLNTNIDEPITNTELLNIDARQQTEIQDQPENTDESNEKDDEITMVR
jgi:hypothetical protein